MATFVLVHGSMHGGWCWQRVAPLLRAAGHEVFTPTLTGLGERVHLAHPDIDLDTHIQDVLGVLEDEDLHDVVLVGHSYATLVIIGVADRLPERIAHLVYLDGPIAGEGQALLDFFPPDDQAG
jgi:pimeloyl-ACP methyl ester carboxylesterase